MKHYLIEVKVNIFDYDFYKKLQLSLCFYFVIKFVLFHQVHYLLEKFLNKFDRNLVIFVSVVQ